MRFHFLSTPIEIKGKERVEEVVFGINKIEGDKVIATGETYSIKCGLVISGIGYESLPIEGIPFQKGKVRNTDGHVEGTNIYVVGWAKRGPSGVIGTNKSDSSDVMKILTTNLSNPKKVPQLKSLLDSRGITHLNQGHWQLLNAAEVAEGEPQGKPRVKFTDKAKLLGFAG